MKKTTTTPKEDSVIDVLKKLTKRIEEATVDIHNIRGDTVWINLKIRGIEADTGVIKSDMEKMRSDVQNIRVEIKEAVIDLEKKIILSEKRIINEVSEFIDQNLLPHFEDKANKKDLEKLAKEVAALKPIN